MVLLKHTLPDGSFHYDWMLARTAEPEDDDRDLVTFRVADRIDRGMTDPVRTVRLDDHRAAYLHFEGDIGRGRGSVRRVDAGECVIERDEPGAFVARIRWGGGDWITLLATPICGEPGANDAWLIEFAPVA